MTENPTYIGLFELNRRIRLSIREQFPDPIWIAAEISDMTINRSGHCYLELVEKEPGGNQILARMRATIWAGIFRMLKPYFETATGQALEPGISILVRADLEFHELYSISLNIRDIEPSFTIGEMARKRQLIINTLKESGFFDLNRELEMPLVPQRIAVISSPTAAGYGDFIDQLNQNGHGFAFRTRLFPAVMQGAETAPSIIAALQLVNRSIDRYDAVAIIRGGGSKLDLSSFDDLDLAIHVANIQLPVITGIGHDQDDTIVDLVAHTRCKTPTAAAEFLIDRVAEFEIRLEDAAGRTSMGATNILNQAGNRLAQAVEGMRLRIRGYADYRHLALDQAALRCRLSTRQFLRSQSDLLATCEQLAISHDPVRLLKRGYSITLKNGKPVTSARQVIHGDELITKLHHGTITSVASELNIPSE